MTTSLAHYNLLDQLGTGGIGDVFRARDAKVGRTVALKIVSPLLASDPARLAAFLEDARLASALSHPNIATLWDIGEADGRYYLAYEFAAGRRLTEEAGGAPMNPRRALDLSVQIADGVAEGHSNGVIHGDLRPDTITVTAKGNAKILDFGLAHWSNGGGWRVQAARSISQLPIEAVGVIAYMSPEQAIGNAVDPRTDVFSLGTITYELVTGKNPFAAATPAETLMNITRGNVPPASTVNIAVPKELDALLARALTRDLDRRQQSAAALAAELRSVAAMLDVRTGDTLQPSALLEIDDTPDKRAASMLTGALVAAAAGAALLFWLLM
jgi:serine/threonine protein kinase